MTSSTGSTQAALRGLKHICQQCPSESVPFRVVQWGELQSRHQIYHIRYIGLVSIKSWGYCTADLARPAVRNVNGNYISGDIFSEKISLLFLLQRNVISRWMVPSSSIKFCCSLHFVYSCYFLVRENRFTGKRYCLNISQTRRPCLPCSTWIVVIVSRF